MSTSLGSLLGDSPLRVSLTMLFLSALVLVMLKPQTIYDDEKDEFKSFGVGSTQTLLPFWLAITIVGALAYYLAVASGDGSQFLGRVPL